MKRMKPTQGELLDHILERAKEDPMQLEVPDYIAYLDKEHAKRLYPADVHAKIDASWEQGAWSAADILKRIVDYIPKAFDWANRQKDFETMRAYGHFIAWTWLLGDREFSSCLVRHPWIAFGKPAFRLIAKQYGVAWEPLDDGVLAEMPDLGIDLADDGSVVLDMRSERVEPMTSEGIMDAAWESVERENKSS